MREAVVAAPTVDDLTRYVHRALCEPNALDPSQAPLRVLPLTRGKRPCGLLFQLEGPRQLRPSAVWAADDRKVIFYDTHGGRVGETILSESPELCPAPRQAA